MSDLSKTIGKEPDWEGACKRQSKRASKYQRMYIDAWDALTQIHDILSIVDERQCSANVWDKVCIADEIAQSIIETKTPLDSGESNGVI